MGQVFTSRWPRKRTDHLHRTTVSECAECGVSRLLHLSVLDITVCVWYVSIWLHFSGYVFISFTYCLPWFCVFEFPSLLIKTWCSTWSYPSCDLLTSKTKSPPSHHKIDVFLLKLCSQTFFFARYFNPTTVSENAYSSHDHASQIMQQAKYIFKLISLGYTNPITQNNMNREHA